MDYGLRGTLPSRPVRAPSIRFLSIDSHVCLMLPSDPASAAVALASSLGLYLHQVGQRTFTSKLLSMPSTHRHRGGGHPPTPATPPCVRVRTRRFELVALAFIDQRWKSERFEVGIGKPNREGFGPSEVPGAASATVVASQSRTNPQCQQCRSTTARCFPLPPQRCTQSQPDPAGQVLQHHRRFPQKPK